MISHWPSVVLNALLTDNECWMVNNGLNAVCLKKKTRVSCQYHLRNIAKIKKLSEDTFKTLVNVFISSKLDNCHSLLYGLSKHRLRSRGGLPYKKGRDASRKF